MKSLIRRLSMLAEASSQKLNCALVTLLLCGGIGRVAAQDPAFVTNGLVAYFPFNGNSRDYSGNAFDGTPHSIAASKDRFGNGSGSVEFDGANSFIEVPSFSSQKFSDQVTISFWFLPSIQQDGFDHYILSTVSSSPTPYSGFDVSLMPRTDESAPPGLWFREFGGIDNGTAVSVAGFSLISSNTWNHAVYTLKGTSASIRINGNLVPPWKPSMPFPLVYRGVPLLIGKGKWRTWLDGLYKGRLDDLRIYNRALSDTEATALFQYESTPQGPRIATATAQVVNGFVVGAAITDGGYGYTNNPSVTLSGGGGSGAKATTTQVNGVVTSIVIVNPGFGYTNAPTVSIAPPPFPPRQAVASASMVNGFVVGVSVTDGGARYDTPPTVLLVGGGGSGALAVATVANGVVTGIAVTNPGSGYTATPSVRIASPPFNPSLSVRVKTVRVDLKVVLGRRYQLESSTDLSTWTPSGNPFVAQDELLTQDFDADDTGRFFRINQIP
jgi:hypothetical protein